MIARNQNPTAQGRSQQSLVRWSNELKQQHATSLKTEEMFYRTTFVPQTFLIASKLHAT